MPHHHGGKELYLYLRERDALCPTSLEPAVDEVGDYFDWWAVPQGQCNIPLIYGIVLQKHPGQTMLTRHFSPPVQQHHASSRLPFIVDSPTTTVEVGLYRPGRSLPQSHDPRRLRQREEFTSHSQSAVDLANTLRQITLDQSEGQPLELQDQVTGYQTGPRLCDAVSQKLDDVITGIDCGTFSGNEADLVITSFQPALRGGDSRNRGLSNVNEQKNATKPRAVVHNHFSKVHFYANSTLPPHLPPVKL